MGHAAAIQSVLSRLLFLQEIELLDPANVAAIAGDLNARYKGFLSVLAPFWNKGALRHTDTHPHIHTHKLPQYTHTHTPSRNTRSLT